MEVLGNPLRIDLSHGNGAFDHQPRCQRGIKSGRLTIVGSPLTMQPSSFVQIWHERRDADPGHRWLREAVAAAVRGPDRLQDRQVLRQRAGDLARHAADRGSVDAKQKLAGEIDKIRRLKR